MRKIISIILSVVHILLSTSAYGKSLEEAIDSAKQLRDALNRNYENHLRALVKNEVRTQYLLLFWDHYSVREFLGQKAYRGISRLGEIKQEFEELRSRTFIGNEGWDENATKSLSLLAQAQNLMLESRQIEQDASTLQRSWERQCRSELLRRNAQFVDPSRYQELIEIGEASAVKPNLEIGFQVSADFSGNVQPEAQDGTAMSETDQAIVSVGTGLIYTANPIAVIVGIVVLVAWAIYKIGSYLHELAKGARLEGELLDIKEQIRQIQLAAIDRVSSDVPEIVRTRCQEAFPKQDALQMKMKIFEEYRNQSQEVFGDLKSMADGIISSYKDRYLRLDQFYYPQVQSGFLASVESRFSKKEKIEGQVTSLIKNVLTPLIRDVSTSRSVDSWRAQDQLWSAIIGADALFRTDQGYSFREIKAGHSSRFSNSWNSIGPRLKELFQ